MTTIIIEDNSPQAKQFVKFARTLPFASVIEERTKSFKDACVECDAVPLDIFIDELKDNVKKHFDRA